MAATVPVHQTLTRAPTGRRGPVDPGQPRRRGPGRRTPASPLQAARVERGWLQVEVVEQIRQVCAGHDGWGGCLLPVSRLSEWETRVRRPSIPHIESLCRVYESDPEELGLITWRTPEQAAEAERDLRGQLLREELAAVARLGRGELDGDPAARAAAWRQAMAMLDAARSLLRALETAPRQVPRPGAGGR